jgi:hypothetical protein
MIESDYLTDLTLETDVEDLSRFERSCSTQQKIFNDSFDANSM